MSIFVEWTYSIWDKQINNFKRYKYWKKAYINLLLLEMHMNTHMGQNIPLEGVYVGDIL
jgi:hypothetical protein